MRYLSVTTLDSAGTGSGVGVAAGIGSGVAVGGGESLVLNRACLRSSSLIPSFLAAAGISAGGGPNARLRASMLIPSRADAASVSPRPLEGLVDGVGAV